MTDFYHLCFAVSRVEDATDELGDVLGVRWGPGRAGRLGDWDYRIVFSAAGPPFFEVIEGPAESPWDVTATGPRFDHIGYWAGDVVRDKVRLAERGAEIEFDSCPYGRSFTYHRLGSIGSRVELVDVGAQAGFIETWAPGTDPMPVLQPPDRD